MSLKVGALISKWNQTSLVLRILIGLVLGTILALTVPQWKAIGVLGIVFVSALKAIAPILVAVLVAASIAKAGGGLGARFRTVIFEYLLSTFLAAFSAVIGSFLFPIKLQLSDVVDDAILFWALMMGVALKLVASRQTIDVVHDFSKVITQIVKWVIQFAPFGILGLVFKSVSESGMDVFSTYGQLVLLLVGCMLTTAFVFNPLISFLMLRHNPYPLLFTCLKVSGLQAFFTRSSAANIPINLSLCKKLGLDEEFYSVSIPLGATINMNGAAVTVTVMTLAVAHTVGVEVSFLSALFLSLIATLAACGASGVAGGSLLLIPMACSFLNIGNDVAMQAVAVGFIIGVIQDSVETAINSSGDVFFTATAEYYDRTKKKQ